MLERLKCLFNGHDWKIVEFSKYWTWPQKKCERCGKTSKGYCYIGPPCPPPVPECKPPRQDERLRTEDAWKLLVCPFRGDRKMFFGYQAGDAASPERCAGTECAAMFSRGTLEDGSRLYYCARIAALSSGR